MMGDNLPRNQPLFYDVPKRMAVDIAFQNITYSVQGEKGTKVILKSVSGEFSSGELTAIMGPSGAGKSSLMNILAGFEIPKVKGDILVNKVERDLKKFRKMSCYIMQRDELCPLLSVSEVMLLAANLKIGNQMSSNEKQQMIEEILTQMGLQHAVSTRTARLSGGEMKRLAIALELINNPPIMFFDEPTSGLDSSSCLQCISLLKTLARGGRTVICVIHQPSSSLFEMFDQLYMLAEGKCIYGGLTSELVSYLSSSVDLHCPSHHNPADFAIDVASGKYGKLTDKLDEANRSGTHRGRKRVSAINASELDASHFPHTDLNGSSHEKESSSSAVSCHSVLLDDIETQSFTAVKVSFWMQFALLFKKSFICSIRDQTLTHLRIAVHIIVGLLVGLLYYGIGNEAAKVFSNAGHVFFSQLFLMFTALMATVLTFPLEMPVLIREHLNNWYSLKAYFLAKSAADLPFQIIYPAIYVVIVYFMTDQPMDPMRFFMYLSMGILTSFVAQSVGLAIGAAFEIETAVFMGPVSMALLVLFSGFFVTFSTVPPYLRWLCYSAYLRYGFEGTISSLYDYNRTKLHCSEAFCHFRSPEKFIEALDIEESVYWFDVAALAIFFVVIRIITFFILMRKIRFRN